MKLIDKDALVAEIEKLKGKISDGSSYCNGWQHALRILELSLDSLEVKDVDIEKEIKEEYLKSRHYGGKFNMLVILNESQFNDIAKHFFELGLKEQIMTSKLQQRISVLKMEFWTGLQTFEETEMTLSDAYNQGVDDILEELGLKAHKGE